MTPAGDGVLRVGLDAHVLASKPEGIRTYVAHLARALIPGLASRESLTFYGCGPDALDGALDGAWNCRPWRVGSPWIRIPFEVPLRERRDRLRVFHSQYICPPVSGASEVVTLHDILFESNPEWFSPGFVARSRLLYRLSAHRCRAVATDSVHSRNEILRRYRVPDDKVHVVPLAGDHVHRWGGKEWDACTPAERVRLAALPRPFHVCVGRLDRRKNLDMLIGVYRALRRRGDWPPLVLVGPADYGAEAFLERMGPDQDAGHVLYLGSVSDAAVTWLLREAAVLAYPTLGEGFGLPVLEAMALGTQVVTSPVPAIREFADGCVRYADPNSAAELQSALLEVSGGSGTAVQARARAAEYTWARVAGAMWGIYRDVA